MGKVLSPIVFIVSLALILLFGLGFVGGLYYLINGNPFAASITYTPVSQEPSSFSLQINTPEDDALVFDPNLLVTGKTAEFASVIIANGDATLGFDADSKGNFSKIITLKEGPNILNITAFDKTGITKSITKQVYYSKEKLEDEE